MDGDIKSEQYPDHMCNRSYLRSSYNDSGYNSVVGKLIGKELYYIFGMHFDGVHEMEGYVPYDEKTETGGWWVPSPEHLEKCRERAVEVLTELSAIARPLRCFDVSFYEFTEHVKPLKSYEAIQYVYDAIAKQEEREANLTEEQRASGMFSAGSYSTGQGYFHLGTPITVVAHVVGINALGTPCIHVVYEDDISYYIQTTEIVVEMIDTMLAKPGASMSWSG